MTKSLVIIQPKKKKITCHMGDFSQYNSSFPSTVHSKIKANDNTRHPVNSNIIFQTLGWINVSIRSNFIFTLLPSYCKMTNSNLLNLIHFNKSQSSNFIAVDRFLVSPLPSKTIYSPSYFRLQVYDNMHDSLKFLGHIFLFGQVFLVNTYVRLKTHQTSSPKRWTKFKL